MGEDKAISLVLEAGKKYGVDEALIIYTSKVEVKNWAAAKCRYGCAKYQRSYSCPPNSIAPEKMQEMMREYKRAVLVIGKEEGVEKQKDFRKALIEMEKELFLNEFYKAFALVPGPCDSCGTCKVVSREACCMPSQNRPCIEGTGIDVFALVKRFKKNAKVNKDPSEPFRSYGLILLD